MRSIPEQVAHTPLPLRRRRRPLTRHHRIVIAGRRGGVRGVNRWRRDAPASTTSWFGALETASSRARRQDQVVRTRS